MKTKTSLLLVGVMSGAALSVLASPPPTGDGPVMPAAPAAVGTFSWIHAVEALSPAVLTVLAQLISPNDTGRLVWDTFMPRQDVGSVEIPDLTTTIYRPVADRRGWNRRGRRIPVRVPSRRDLEMEPIESNFRIDEREMQRLIERFLGNEDLIQQKIMVDIPDRTQTLAQANYRRVEFDVLDSWANGTVTARDPESGDPQAVQYQFAPERMATAGTPWDTEGFNAYDAFISWMTDALAYVGPIKGAVIRLKARRAILNTAPKLMGGAQMSLALLEDRISQDLNSPFQFFLLEDTLDVFNGGGITSTRTHKWPTGKIAAIPNDGLIGRTAFAPIGRAMTLSNAVPEAKIDVNGCAVFVDDANGGRELDVECQLNALPVPDENRVFVLDTGIVG